MILRRTSLLFIFVLVVLTVDNRATRGNLQPLSNSVKSTSVVCRHDCNDERGTIRITLLRLSSGDYGQVQDAKKVLVNIAHKSNDCRGEVIRALIEAMDKPNLDFERQLSNYYLWREGSQLLGELRAIEALDLLIAHLDATNGFHSSSMVFQPAIIGVRQMGKAAVPKLTLALKENPKPSIRMAAAYCLTDIGGEAAMHALSQAQEDESNRCVTNFIRVSLNTFRYQSKNGIAFDNDAPQANGEARGRWLLAFQCVE
jgi:hypothetical protein